MGSRTIWWKRKMRAFASFVPAPVPSEATATSVRLTWTAVTDAATYALQQGSVASMAENIVWETFYTTPSGLTHVDEGLAADTTYLYRLAVTDAAGETRYSTSVTVTTLADSEPPVTPTEGPEVVRTGTTSIDLSMPSVPGATRYILQRRKFEEEPPPPPPPPPGDLEFTSTLPADIVVTNALTGYSQAFAWDGPADHTYWTRFNNDPWVNGGTAKTKTVVVGGIGPSFPNNGYDNISDAGYQTFQVVSRSPQGVYSAPIVHEWRASVFDLARPFMSGTWDTLFIRTQWSGTNGNLLHGTDAQDRASITEAFAPISGWSRNTLTSTYDMTAVLTIPRPASTTFGEDAGDYLKAIVMAGYDAAVAAGWAAATYDQIIVATPRLDGPAAGVAWNTETPRKAWVGDGLDLNQPREKYMITHEIGHNLGFGHDGTYVKPFTSASFADSDDATGHTEYGDESSAMASSRDVGYPSAIQMSKTPWVKRPKNVVVNGTYTISSIETNNPANPHALLINVPNPVIPKRRVYWVSLRQATGLNAYMSDSTFISNYGDFTAGVVIQVEGPGGYAAGGAISLGSNKNVPLPVNSTFTDPDGTMTIKLLSKTASTATIQVGGLPTAPIT